MKTVSVDLPLKTDVGCVGKILKVYDDPQAVDSVGKSTRVNDDSQEEVIARKSTRLKKLPTIRKQDFLW
jgi:DNA-directed RNA polymerase subunit H (RpoH/RPB5)